MSLSGLGVWGLVFQAHQGEGVELGDDSPRLRPTAGVPRNPGTRREKAVPGFREQNPRRLLLPVRIDKFKV